MSEQNSFWDAECFVVVTDKTKPAMKLTIDELASRGKKVYVVDMSDTPIKGAIQSISELPSDVDRAIIGVPRTNPADLVDSLEEKGFEKFWIHWRTETSELKRKCMETKMTCITGKCPMMYLSQGFNIHTLHKNIAKLIGKY
jgi:predicted CoA-binding protein